MYRENVLLALTLFLTILILTFILHIVMHFQKANIDRRLEEESKILGQIRVEDHNHDSYLNMMAFQQQILDKEWMEKNYRREGQQDDLSAVKTIYQHQPETPTPDYGFDDPPPGSIEFLFQFDGSNGYISLEMPVAQSKLLADLEYGDLFINNLLKHNIAKKLKDNEPKLHGPVLESAPIKNRIWFMPHALKALAEKFVPKTTAPGGGDNEPTRNASENSIYKQEINRG